MSAKMLRPWVDLVGVHPDVEGGQLTESVFAIDLGAIHENDPNVPAVNRDAAKFFRATYLTADLRRLLEEVLSSLDGKEGFNRVLKLRTPFGGGKSHTMATLLHACRSRKDLNVIPEGAGLPDPGEVRIAVFDGEKFDARTGKTLPDGRVVQTMWGWIAWQIDPDKAYPIVEQHDKERVSPGGDVIRQVLTEGASNRPVLLLLDEVLKYMERAAAVQVLESSLQRQSKDFFQNLTIEIAGSKRAAMLYSLQWSARESLGNIALLNEIDKLAGRVDQLREPVSGDEIIPVLHRRLLAKTPPVDAASEVADNYSSVVTTMRKAVADNDTERHEADREGLVFRNRLQSAYPFHPALIDLMRERWLAVDSFQRTRGSLRFLASCLYSQKKKGGARALLGPGDVPLGDVEVRVKLLKELGVQNEYDAVISADLEGPSARAKKIDDRLAKESPQLGNVRPAMRLATAIFLYSFGGLRREGSAGSELLPPGISENELLGACLGPDLDSITASAVLAELRNSCLYLHYDGVRYCFKKEANVTKLIEDAEQEVAREELRGGVSEPVSGRIKDLMLKKLAGHHSAFVWPEKSQELPDHEPLFITGYLPLNAARDDKDLRQKALDLLFKWSDRTRVYRNGICLAVADVRQAEGLRRAVRYLLAIERVEKQKQQFRLTKEQLDQLKERRQTEEAAMESSLRGLYSSVLLPRVDAGVPDIERIEIGGRPLQATGVHERIMELLTSTGTPKVHGTVTPRKVAERLGLGESNLSVSGKDARDSFFSVLEPPRLKDAEAIKVAICKGVEEGVFAWYTGTEPKLNSDDRFDVSWERVAFQRRVAVDEIDFESGYLIWPVALPLKATAATASVGVSEGAGDSGGSSTPYSPGTGDVNQGSGTVSGAGTAVIVDKATTVQYKFTANRDQVFKSFAAIANLSDKSDGNKVTITIDAVCSSGFDKNWLRNAVNEPLDEADVVLEN